MTKKNLQKLIREETAKVLSEDNLTESVAWQAKTTKEIKTLNTLLKQVLGILRPGPEKVGMPTNTELGFPGLPEGKVTKKKP